MPSSLQDVRLGTAPIGNALRTSTVFFQPHILHQQSTPNTKMNREDGARLSTRHFKATYVETLRRWRPDSERCFASGADGNGAQAG